MGRRDNQQQNTQPLGRRDRTQQASTTVTQPTPRKQGNFITNAPENIGMLFRGEIKAGDVARRMPGVARRGAIKTAQTVAPALSNFFETTGGIIGEGVAYAIDPNVRKQYRAGNLDILPTITKTTQGDLLKDTVAAAIETAVIRSVPAAVKGKLGTRLGVGGLEGIGFAVAEGLAKDHTPEEIMKNATLYGVAGSTLNAAAPWLGSVLRKEIGRAPKTLKKALKEEAETVAKKTNAPESVTTPETLTTTTPETPTTPPQTGTKVQQVQGEQIPIGGPTKGPSRLEARLVAQTEDPAYQAGVSNYAKYSKAADAPDVTGSANVEQIRRASTAVEQMSPVQIEAVVSGTADLPPGVLRTAFLKAAGEQATLEGHSSLVKRLARAAGQLARRLGQEVQFTKNFDPLDPVTNLADILSVRLAAAERRVPKGEKVSTYIKKNVDKGKKAVSKDEIKIQEAESLLDSILCP